MTKLEKKQAKQIEKLLEFCEYVVENVCHVSDDCFDGLNCKNHCFPCFVKKGHKLIKKIKGNST